MTTRLLAQPLPLKHHTLRNRVIMGSMHTGFEEHPEGAEHLAAFYAERAKGGVALIITGGIGPNAEGAVMENGAKLTTEEEVAWHRIVTDAVHEHGAKICMQILHTGRYAMSREPVAPSALQAPINPARPRALSTEEVRQTVRDYVRCAQLARQAGYDGVEIMGSEGYLINQFLAPATNQRDDEYGGSLENRHRFAVEIVSGIRQAVGEDFLLIYRMSLMDLVENGSTWAENEILADKIQAAGADLFNTGIGWHEARIPTIATCVPRGAFTAATAKLKSISKIPVVATNRINMPVTAEAILQSHQADAVCLARPFLADAAWVNKAAAGQDNAINTCIACNQACLDHIFAGKLTSCLVNPFACHEKQLIAAPLTVAKNIAVVGAGPAGLAFAITAAERGHTITLFDAAADIGGQLNVAKKIPGKPEFNEMLRYFRHRLSELNVTQQLGKKVAVEDVQGFDEIVLATGIVPRRIDIEGATHEKVLSYLDVLRDEKAVGQKVAIIGAGGIGFDTAEYLSQSGADSALSVDEFNHEWQLDTSLEQAGALLGAPQLPPSAREIHLLQRREGMVGRDLGKTTGWIHRTVLKLRGVTMTGGVTYDKIDDAGLHVTIGGEAQVLAVDNVVICAGQEPEQSLAQACRDAGLTVHIIGGASDARALDAKKAILHGTQIALEI
ncbi:MAG: FAD-dependent oxidoreductase [Neisseria sp.]|nr:FAD-dependent oxidoreductase [Neisseria sp.]